VQGKPGGQGGIVGRQDAVFVRVRQRHRTGRLGLANLLVRRAQKLVHRAGPRLLLDLDERLEFAQVVGIAQGVLSTAQGVVWSEMIVHDDAVSHGSGHVAARLADAVVGIDDGRGTMQPACFAADAKACLVQVAHLRRHDACGDMLYHRRLRLGGVRRPSHHAGGAEAAGREQIGHDLADPVLGDQLLDIQVDRCCPQVRSVLHMGRHRVWKRRLRGAVAMMASVDRGLVFGDLQAWLGQVKHLPPFHLRHHRRGQASLAVSARGCGVTFDAVGLVHLTQGIPLVADLPAASLARPTTQAFEHARWFFQAVA
jgi:hypothetical protein